jgi:LysR family glycine cleavage system transcriptional activator
MPHDDLIDPGPDDDTERIGTPLTSIVKFARRPREPSLRALRAFEVVGRHLNMQTAAEELCITVSAVSHQIRYLEEELSTRLFKRTGRGLELTADGAALLPNLAVVFEQLANTIDGFRRRSAPDVLNVSMPMTFAMRWFIPRLHRFQALHPAIDIRIASHDQKDLQRLQAVDCYVRFGDGTWPGLETVLLFTERLSLVCSPKILRSTESAIVVPGDVLKHRLLYANDRRDDWDLWARSLFVELRNAHRTLHFENRDLAIQAAIEALGIALADPVEIGDELRIGRLVQPLGPTQPNVTRGYYFVTTPGRSGAGIAALKSWLITELQIDG